MAKQDEEEDRRREAAIASAPPLRPNFKPAGVTQQQISKFQELHRRRLQIKSKSKVHKKSKDGRKNHAKDLDMVDYREKDPDAKVEDNIISPNSEIHSKGENPSPHQDNSAMQLVPKRPQKLHWGLDSKERWERKANM